MRVLLSIKPQFAESILNGEKRFEFRKSIFKNRNVKTVVIYATMPVGKVIGEFDVGNIISSHPVDLWRETQKYAGISKEFFDEYFSMRSRGFAIVVKNPRRYDIPMSLHDLSPGLYPPQSFRYL